MEKLHMIGHAHLDPIWLWRWTEGFQEVKATFRSALDRMNEDADFKFTTSSAIFYEWLEQSNPAMLEEIKARVAEGRWEISGGWLIEPDCNIPSGESFARQGLYGQRFFQSRFGKTATVGFAPDSFGHNGSLPQVLLQSGMDSYAFMRPMPEEKDLPGSLFRWQSPDGSEVMAYRIPFSYGTWGTEQLSENAGKLRALLAEEDETALMQYFGVGNHGGGPTKQNIQNIHELQAANDGMTYAFSTMRAFFDELRENGKAYPLVCDDLQHHARGCYTVMSAIKKWNRSMENLLITAETWSVVANAVQKQPYPADYTQAWKDVLLNQFHDILAGTSLVSAYEDARHLYGEAGAIAQRGLNLAIQALTWDIEIEREEGVYMRPLVAFNPHAWGGKMVCEIDVRFLENNDFELLDETGAVVPAQRVQPESVTTTGKLLFVAELPPLGYRVFRLYLKKDPARFPSVPVSGTTVENDALRLTLNPETGFVSGLFDKKRGTEVLRGEGARLVVIEDKYDTWAHGIARFDKVLAYMTLVSIDVSEEGPVRSTLRAKYRYNDSLVTQSFRLYKELDAAEVRMDIDWREPLTMLKAAFPVNTGGITPTLEIPFASLQMRADGVEIPGQAWIDGTGEQNGITSGLAIANTAKYGYSFENNEIRMTVLRNSVYAHHDPAELDPAGEYEYTDHGKQSFMYALLPHDGTWKNSNILRATRELNMRPYIQFESFHEGSLPQKKSFIQVDSAQVFITAMKQAEDGGGLILRAYEATGAAAEATFDLLFMGRQVKAVFKPFEIKTFFVPSGDGAAVREVNMLEW